MSFLLTHFEFMMLLGIHMTEMYFRTSEETNLGLGIRLVDMTMCRVVKVIYLVDFRYHIERIRNKKLRVNSRKTNMYGVEKTGGGK